MKPFLAAILVLSICLPVAAQRRNDGEYPFWIEQIKSPQSVRFVAINSGPATVTVSMSMAGNNFQPDKTLPLTLVIEPDSILDLVSIVQTKRWEPLRFHYRYSFLPGDANALPDLNARYCLPFAEGTPFIVTQSPGGKPTTHNNEHSRYAIDFAVPEGTLVTAAREGTVIDIKDSFTAGGPDPALDDKANFVAIMHADRTIGWYLHLMPHRVLVRPGQRVNTGNAIAYSGNTGYTYGPHLHFDVRQAAVTEKGAVVHQSVPIDFYTRGKTSEKLELKEGTRIRAQ